VQQPPATQWPEVGQLQSRATRPERIAAQQDLDLPAYPTTTTGSLPQTSGVRQLRARLGKGELDRDEYDAQIGTLITDAIAWQERMGLDVLVHGEFEVGPAQRGPLFDELHGRLHAVLVGRHLLLAQPARGDVAGHQAEAVPGPEAAEQRAEKALLRAPRGLVHGPRRVGDQQQVERRSLGHQLPL